MPLTKPADIIAAVDEHISSTQELRNRFDTDWALYRLERYKPAEEDAEDSAGRPAHVYTSNHPKVVADKVMAWMTTAEMILRAKHDQSAEDQRDADNSLERLGRGLIASADERLENLLEPDFREWAAFAVCVRGWFASRNFLNKDDDGNTYVDIRPWDMLHTAWAVGGDGLDWACLRLKKTKREIVDQYGVAPSGRPNTVSRGLAEWNDTDSFDVYDFFDKTHNTVVMEGQRVLKARTPHNSPRFPITIRFVGPIPLIQTEASDDTQKDVGESLFSAVRDVYADVNEMVSIEFQLASKARKPPTGIPSSDGTKTIDPEDNPWLEGTAASYRTADGPPHALEGHTTTRDHQPTLALMLGELQRGTLPFTAFGELGFSLSGFAINQLSQGIEDVLTPRLKALKSIYREVLTTLFSQYETRGFAPIRLSGRDGANNYFDEEFPIETVERFGRFDIEFIANLPKDDQTKMAMAQMARQPDSTGLPMFPDRWIYDHIMEIEDSDGLEDEVLTQMSARGLPEARLYKMMLAAADRGETQLAQIYLGELQFVYKMKLAQRAAAFGPPPGSQQSGNQNTNGAGPTLDPRVGPDALINPQPVAPGVETVTGPSGPVLFAPNGEALL